MNPETSNQAKSEPRSWTPSDFKSPPLVRRRFLIRLDIPKAAFEEHATSLVESIEKEGRFDNRGLKEQWDFRLDMQDAPPKPRVLLTHIPMLIRSSTGDKPMTVLEFCPPIEAKPAQFVIEQERTDAAASRFADFEREIHTWLPRVTEHFGLARVGGFVLEYRNLIQRDRYPIFWEKEKTLQLGRLLSLFENGPKLGSFVTPFSLEFNAAKPCGKTRFQTKTVPEKGKKQEFALEVALAYNSLAKKEKHDLAMAFKEVSDAHGLLFHDFVRHFSRDALQVFAQ